MNIIPLNSHLLVIAAITALVAAANGSAEDASGLPPHSAASPEGNAASRTVVEPPAGNLPLSFELNQGQSEAHVQFVSHQRGYSIVLSPTEVVFTLKAPAVSPPKTNGPHAEKSSGRNREQIKLNTPRSTVWRLSLVGANPDAAASGVDELPGRVNYISGPDRTKWQTDIPTYAKVQYDNVYPGVNLLYYGDDQRRLEYDFEIAPGADPKRIRLKFNGVDSLNVNDAGELVLHAAGRELRQHRPQIYQEIDGVRRVVPGGYKITQAREVGFALGEYDPSRPLVIDPVITYSTYAGGVNADPYTGDHDSGNDIAVDASGNMYVVATANAVDRYDTDVLVRKFNPSGTTLLYATYLDSTKSNDRGNGIAVDSAGNAYVTGQFGDPMLPGWGLGVLVAKLSSTGIPVYSGTFGAGSPGYRMDEGMRIAVDDVGHAYIVGTTHRLGSAFPTTPGAFQRSSAGGRLTDAFVVKVNPSGTDFVYSTLLGGTGDEEGLGIAIRKVGTGYNAYVIGVTSLAGDFPTTPGAFQRTFGGGGSDVFVAQLNGAGSALVYSTFLGGNGRDRGNGIAVDAAGNAYLTGWTGKEPLDSLSRFPIVNAFQPIYGGQGGATPAAANAFVTKLNPTGSGLIYSSYMGGGGYGLWDAGVAIKVDAVGNAYLTGITGTRTDLFTGSRFPILNAFQPNPGSSGYDDAFVAKVSPQGALLFSSYLGGSYRDEGHGIAVDAAGNVYLTGMTMSADFRTTAGAYQKQIAGGGCAYPFSCPDAFVTKISTGNATAVKLSVTKTGTGSGTVTSSPAGISCGTDCSEQYNIGTMVALTARAAAGFAFAGWSGSCAGTATCSVTMSAAKSVTAKFVPVVTISATDASATEAGRTTGRFTVKRTGSTAAALTVYYGVSGQATATSDYTALSGNVIIPVGATAASIVVTPVDDAVAESTESVTVTLKRGTAYAITTAASATVLITDNDAVATRTSATPQTALSSSAR